MVKKSKTCIALVLFFVLALAGCINDAVYTGKDARLRFSADTVSFDTLITTLGSPTLNFRVFNPKGKDIEIRRVWLGKGAKSPFRINVDGVNSNSISNIRLNGSDSLYVFVELTPGATDSGKPLIIEDSIVFETNGNLQVVRLMAYGQDAYHIKIGKFTNVVYLDETGSVAAMVWKSQTLNADKPYLIYNNIYLDSAEVLTIPAGATLLMRKDVSIYIGGTLKIEGRQGERVTIRGSRFDELFSGTAYDKVPGQWGNIHLLAGSAHNEINYADIVNGTVGLVVDTVVTPGVPTLRISNSKVLNMTGSALFARGAVIDAKNCLFANCQQYVVALAYGGSYDFTHCTIGNYYDWGIMKEPTLALNNFYLYGDRVMNRDLVKASFNNCIVYGSSGNNLGLLNKTEDGKPVSGLFNYNFNSCLLRVSSEVDTLDKTHFVNCVWNKDPKFVSPTEKLNFKLDTLSAAKDRANPLFSIGLESDLDGNSRTADGKPDIGAYERIEKK